MLCVFFFFFKQKTAYEMRISDWSSDVCSSDLKAPGRIIDRVAREHFVARGQQREQRAGDRGETRGVDERLVGIFEVAERIAQCTLGREADTAVGHLAAIVERLAARQQHSRAALDRKSTRLNSSH